MSFNPDGFFLERLCNASIKAKEISTQMLTFKNEKSILGKDDLATFNLTKNVEPLHCEISFREGVPYLRNLVKASSLGTWINGMKINNTTEEHSLRLGDLIGLGVDPSNFANIAKDESKYYIYKVSKVTLVETIEIIDSDDETESEIANNIIAAPINCSENKSESPPNTRINESISIVNYVSDHDGSQTEPDVQYTAEDYHEDMDEKADKENSQEISNNIDVNDMFDIIDDEESQKSTSANMNEIETENPAIFKKGQRNLISEEELKKKIEHMNQMQRYNKPEVPIIKPHCEKKRRGGMPETNLVPKISPSIDQRVPSKLDPEKKRKKMIHTAETKERRERLADVAKNSIKVEKKKPKPSNSAVKAKITRDSRSEKLSHAIHPSTSSIE